MSTPRRIQHAPKKTVFSIDNRQHYFEFIHKVNEQINKPGVRLITINGDINEATAWFESTEQPKKRPRVGVLVGS